MSFEEKILENEEKVIFALRELYSKYGYIKYRMSKFEEYDLYVKNKNFLVSENIITFTDIDGKLMALKPDVTLSIVKNSRDEKGAVNKVYYNENVYRASSSTRAFKEIMQTGLEAIGDVDDYCIAEVVLLATKSLECISDDFVLDISHMGIVSEAIDRLALSERGRKEILKALSEKNIGGIASVCDEEKVDREESAFLKNLVSLYGSPKEVIAKLKAVARDENKVGAIAQLERIVEVIEQNGFIEKTRIDFSVVNDGNYYNGVVFKGYINGIPQDVLSGGQYDNLMRKMSRKSGAIGFAVYMDVLERLYMNETDFDVDAVLIYDENICPMEIDKAMNTIRAKGESVVAQKIRPEKIRFKKLYKLCGGEVKVLEQFS